jgi:hypothetical protein
MGVGRAGQNEDEIKQNSLPIGGQHYKKRIQLMLRWPTTSLKQTNLASDWRVAVNGQ